LAETTPTPTGPTPAGGSARQLLTPVVLAVLITLLSIGGFNFFKAHLRWVNPTPVPTPGPTPPKPDTPPQPDPKPAPLPDWFGLNYDGGQHQAIVATMKPLAKAAPDLMEIRDPADTRPILLYKAWATLFSRPPPYPAQQIGDCVSFGHAHANDLLQCVEWVINHPGRTPLPKDIQETDTEALYGMAREAGGMLGRQDGCYGSAAVKAMTTMGVVSRKMLGADGAYSGRRAKQWGLSGAPENVKQIAAKYKLGDAAQVTTWDELVAAQHSGHPVTICTGQGFTLQRDSQGFCRARGRWGHCMFIAGVRFDRPGACIVQSWGEQMPSGPKALDQPSYSFWADQAVIERILSEGDSWALSAAPKFGAGQANKGRRKLPDAFRGGPVKKAA
jgi:hypothetical protein